MWRFDVATLASYQRVMNHTVLQSMFRKVINLKLIDIKR